MDIILAIVTITIITLVWINAGRESGSSGFNDVWKTSPSRGLRKKFTSKLILDARLHALNKAKPFLKSYKDPMGELCLANENCKVNIVIEDTKFKKIVCISKITAKDNTRKILTATASREYETFYNMQIENVVDNLFNLICENFTYSTVYENIYSALVTGMLDVKESVIVVPTQKNKMQKVYDRVTNTSIRTNNLLNINTASEAELSSLPGVNIVTAKKAIKYIEKNGAFESVDEFIEKMKIKDVFADQIKNVICTKFDDVEEKQTNSNQINTDNGINTTNEVNDENDNIYIPHSDNERTIDL